MCEKNFILIRSNAPTMPVTHLATVHAELVKVICKSNDKNACMSPQGIGGDNRCEAYALVKAYELKNKKS